MEKIDVHKLIMLDAIKFYGMMKANNKYNADHLRGAELMLLAIGDWYYKFKKVPTTKRFLYSYNRIQWE